MDFLQRLEKWSAEGMSFNQYWIRISQFEIKTEGRGLEKASKQG